jgi:hypothetical protein
VRFKKEFKQYIREITKRRIGCAERAIKKQQGKIPLFADQMTWPTPIERITAFDRATFEKFVEFRKTACAGWIEGRRLLREMDKDKKRQFLEFWNNSSIPGKAEYFLDSLEHFIKLNGGVDICGKGIQNRER